MSRNATRISLVQMVHGQGAKVIRHSGITQRLMSLNDQPSLLGLQPTFGFGDRLGLATPGHIASLKHGRLLPILAQQSVREMTRTQRTPDEVMAAARRGIEETGFRGVWGADADHLKTREDVFNLAAAGFTFFTIDPSAYVENAADGLTGDDLLNAAERVVASGAFESLKQVESLYAGKGFDIGVGSPLFLDREAVLRAVVKYGRAVDYAGKMGAWIEEARAGKGADIEVSVDETDSPTTPGEHLFIAAELRRRRVRAVSVAPRFCGEFEKGIDYKGDIAVFEAELKVHAAIARTFGPYKISVHSGSDKFRIYPVVAAVCGDLLHVKTAGTSYLEALRVVARVDAGLFSEVVAYSRGRFDADKATYHISATLDGVSAGAGLSAVDLERIYLDEDGGRQILHVTFGSVLTQGRDRVGRTFKEGILGVLQGHPALHSEILEGHLGKHLRLLS